MSTTTKTPRKQIGPELLDFYAQPGPMTSAGRYASMLAELPHDVADLVGIVQGLAIHEYVASDFYGFRIPDERRGESHIRSVEHMLERVLALDGRPLTVRRPRRSA